MKINSAQFNSEQSIVDHSYNWPIHIEKGKVELR